MAEKPTENVNIMPDTALEAALFDLLTHTLGLCTQLLGEATRNLSASKRDALESCIDRIGTTWPDDRAAQLSAVDWLRFTVEHRYAVAKMNALQTGASP